MSINLVELKQRVALAADLFSTKERDLMVASLDVFAWLTEGSTSSEPTLICHHCHRPLTQPRGTYPTK
jgi:hypothetical protein